MSYAWYYLCTTLVMHFESPCQAHHLVFGASEFSWADSSWVSWCRTCKPCHSWAGLYGWFPVAVSVSVFLPLYQRLTLVLYCPSNGCSISLFFLGAYIGSLKLFIPVLRPPKGQGIYLSSSSPSISFARCLGHRYICIVYFRNSSASMLCFICIRNVCRQQLIASIMPLLHGCSAFIKMYKICKLIRSRILQIYVKFLVLPGATANEESSLGNCYTENTRRDFYDGTGGNETLFARWHPLWSLL